MDQSAEVAAVVLDLGSQCRRIEVGGSRVGEGVAGDFMALAVKCHDLIAADAVPMAGPFIDQPARDVEGRPRIIRLENRDADGGRALRRIVERETDHRARVSQPERRNAKVSGQAVADTRLQC